MTRKDFELIAATLKPAIQVHVGEYPTDITGSALRELARDFADALTRTNPLFDRARFLRACGVEGGQ